MRVLALDTTTRAGSAAIVIDGRVAAERAGDGSRSHAERLPGELWAVLDEARLTIRDVDLFAIAAGPGSFTGLRIGIATVQGLAFVRQRPVVAVSALEALAAAASIDRAPASIVAAWMDAHRGEVFSALYRVGGSEAFAPGWLTELEAASVGSPELTLGRWSGIAAAGALFIGDGAVLYASRIGGGARIEPAPLLAGTIGRIAAARAAAGGAVGPAAIHPLYVRRPDAELARAKALHGTGQEG